MMKEPDKSTPPNPLQGHIEYIYARASDADRDPELRKLRDAYYALRYRVFSDKYQGGYPTGGDEFDLKDDTLFCFAVNTAVKDSHVDRSADASKNNEKEFITYHGRNVKVVSGLRVMSTARPTHGHPRADNDRLHFESPNPELRIENLLPNAALQKHKAGFDIRKVGYAELGGVVADPSELYKGLFLGTEIQKFGFQQVKADHHIKTDILFARVTPVNVTSLLKGAELAGLDGIVRPDANVTIGGAKRVMMIFPINPEVAELVYKDANARQLGVPPNDFIASVKAERTKNAVTTQVNNT
jgi:hypothetical protein